MNAYLRLSNCPPLFGHLWSTSCFDLKVPLKVPLLNVGFKASDSFSINLENKIEKKFHFSIFKNRDPYSIQRPKTFKKSLFLSLFETYSQSPSNQSLSDAR
jgi:hypothetical protein